MSARSDGSPISVSVVVDVLIASDGAAGIEAGRITSQPASVDARATTGIDQIILERDLADMKPRYPTRTHRQVFCSLWGRYGIGKPSRPAPKRVGSTSRRGSWPRCFRGTISM